MSMTHPDIEKAERFGGGFFHHFVSDINRLSARREQEEQDEANNIALDAMRDERFEAECDKEERRARI